jgi:hypothetical protein
VVTPALPAAFSKAMIEIKFVDDEELIEVLIFCTETRRNEEKPITELDNEMKGNNRLQCSADKNVLQNSGSKTRTPCNWRNSALTQHLKNSNKCALKTVSPDDA